MLQLNSKTTRYKSNSKVDEASDEANNAKYIKENEDDDEIDKSMMKSIN